MKTVRQHKVFLQYGKAGEPYNAYGGVVGEQAAEQFVDLDSASGGYPYPTTIDRAHDFKTVEKALEYMGHFPGMYVRRVSITYTFQQDERLVKCVACHGTGSISNIVDHDHDYNTVWESKTCSTCAGTGKSEA